MKRIAEQLGIFIGLFLLVGVLRYPYTILPETVSNFLQTSAKKQSIDLLIHTPEISFPLVFKAREIHSEFQSKLGAHSLTLNRAECSFALSKLLGLRLATHCQSELETAEIDVEVSRSFFSHKLNFETLLNDLELTSIPQLAALQISGTGSAEIHGEIQPASGMANAEFTASIREGSYPGGEKLFSLFVTPAMDSVSLDLRGSVEQEMLTVKDANLDSSLGRARAVASARLNERHQIESYRAEIHLELNEFGEKEFGPYLALGTGGKRAASGNWRISVEKKKNQAMPVVKTEAL